MEVGTLVGGKTTQVGHRRHPGRDILGDVEVHGHAEGTLVAPVQDDVNGRARAVDDAVLRLFVIAKGGRRKRVLEEGFGFEVVVVGDDESVAVGLENDAQRIGKVFASVTTWAKLVRARGWRRPRQRVHPPKPTVGVRAAAPNEIWHIDVSVLKLLDSTKAYLHAIIDNYSRKILAWTVAERLDPTANCQLLLAAAKHMAFAGRPLLFADSGIENINSAVDDTLFSACLERVLAQVDVAYSNSMIEAFWRSLKHQWLYLNSLDSIERLRVLVAFFIEQHNTQMPHSAFAGQTPDEMYFGTAVDLPAQLAAARSKAREERLAANRAMTCDQCSGQPTSSPASQIPP